MEIMVSIILVVSIISNFLMINNLKKLHSQTIETLPLEIGSIDCDCKEGLLQEFTEIITPLLNEKTDKIVTPLTPDESHYAWRNQKEEPTKAPPSPHGPPPIPGPLQRPYGFSR